ncbi:hypothetical protein [Lysobacter niastensis]|uniref:Uncharacterized protein n=1 Tax=Lysobacter niastensis TaxID=380629 RepID=A0ABS0B7R2_9GAMM|nr:hypothetical protein [Lysobacter niastensis]MBF6025060.1 hypothetical protein [Lysobacter niastensis]
MDEIRVTRESVCAADDQTMPLELTLPISSKETFGSVMERIAKSAFLQFSSTYTCASGFVAGEPVARVLANFKSGQEAECIAPAEAPACQVIPGGLLEFRWAGSNNSFKPNPLRGSA